MKLENTIKAIYFDMDGTIADLYAVDNWEVKLNSHNPSPYAQAKVMVNMNTFAKCLNKLQSRGVKIGIVSWLAKHSNAEYDNAVTAAKQKWLKKHLASVKFDEVIIVPYGTPKYTLTKYKGVLFDDEEKNRTAWNNSDPENIAFDQKNILNILKKQLTN